VQFSVAHVSSFGGGGLVANFGSRPLANMVHTLPPIQRMDKALVLESMGPTSKMPGVF